MVISLGPTREQLTQEILSEFNTNFSEVKDFVNMKAECLTNEQVESLKKIVTLREKIDEKNYKEMWYHILTLSKLCEYYKYKQVQYPKETNWYKLTQDYAIKLALCCDQLHKMIEDASSADEGLNNFWTEINCGDFGSDFHERSALFYSEFLQEYKNI